MECVLDVIEEETEQPEVEEKVRPNDGDPKWTEYVLDKLEDEELYEGFPTVDGLRRVTEAVFGTVIQSTTDILEIPDENCAKCTAIHTLMVRKHRGLEIVTVNAAVDVVKKYVKPPYDKFIVAMADSRAEGKAYRRLLKLKILSAEELQADDEDTHILIDPQVVIALSNLCKRQDLNVLEVVKKYGKFKNIDEVPKHVARTILKAISNHQNDKKEFSNKKFQGFDPDWKD